jgi:hypothetical protein
MAALSGRDGVGQAGHHRSMAPAGLPLVLALAFEIRAAVNRSRSSESDSANERRQPALGCPRIHGELLKLGIEISQATVAKYMVRRRGTPSQSWRSFLINQAQGIAAIDMFVVACASFSAAVCDDHSWPTIAGRLCDLMSRRIRLSAFDRDRFQYPRGAGSEFASAPATAPLLGVAMNPSYRQAIETTNEFVRIKF